MPEYRIKVLSTRGNALAELPEASLGSFNIPLNDQGTFSFSIPNNAPGIGYCRAGKTEIQVFRDERCVWWGIITRASGDITQTTFQCQTLEWYLGKRVIGPSPLPKFIDQGWNYADGKPSISGWAPRRDKYIKRLTSGDLLVDWAIVSATNKTLSVQPEPIVAGSSMLMVTSLKDSNGMFNRDVRWTNPYTKSVDVYLVAWVYLPTSSNRHSTRHQKGVELSLIDPADSSKPKKTSTVKFSSDFPAKKWTRVKLSVAVPADGKEYVIRAALYAPDKTTQTNNVAYFGNVHVAYTYIDEYVSQDQAYIAHDLLRKAQDPALGKGPLGSGLSWSGGTTGVKRSRSYNGVDRGTLADALQEFITLDNGFDLNVVWGETGTWKWLAGSYPRLGADKPDVVLTTNTNISEFSQEIDSEWHANRIYVIENLDDPTKKEGIYTGSSLQLTPTESDGDPRRLLEMSYTATPGSSWTTLWSQARRGYIRYSRLTRTPSITMSSVYTEELLDSVSLGDRVTVDIRDGWLKSNGLYRIVEISLDPATDQLSYTVSPEDVD